MTKEIKLKPLQQWICDVCGEVIERPKDCYVIWRKNGTGKKFMVIHRGLCDDRSFHSSAAVEDFLGVMGINKLLSLISVGPIMMGVYPDSENTMRVQDLDEFADLFRRMQVPFYEEARQHFKEPYLLEDFSDTNEIYPYQEHVLKRIITDEYED